MSDETLEILLVEDSQSHIALIRRAFVDEGKKFKLTIAGTLAGAREILKRVSPDLLLVDYRLPDGNGIELLPGDSKTLTFPVALLTGHGDEKVATAAMKAGAIDYIVKSDVTLAAIPNIVQRILREWQHLTAYKKMQSVLRLNQYSIDRSPDAAFWIDQDANIVNVNKTTCQRLGYTRDELLTMTVFDFDAEFPRNAWSDHWQDIKKQGSSHMESVHKTKSGEIFPVDISCNYICFDGMEYIFAYAVDITKRKQADNQVQKLSQCIEQAGESIVITDLKGMIEYVNPAFTKLTGYSADKAIGKNPRILKSGNQDAAFYEAMWKTISSGKIWHGKVIDRKKDGSFYPTTLTISPVFTQSEHASRHTHYVGIQSDLTALEDLEQQFHQSQKMEAIGTLVGGIAHDFNNMLAGMTGNLYLAKKKVQSQPDVVQKLDNVEQLSMRAAEMIQQLLTFARKDRAIIKALPFTAFVKETLKLLRSSVPENIAMHEELCGDYLLVKGDATLMHQVLMNLITNARDALEGVAQARMIVRLESFYADEGFAKSRVDFKVGAYARLSVEDNGCGIPKKQLKHLFEPFYTTKEQGKGTGLGLAMVFGAVKTHQGIVEVDSIKGEGSTFHVYLPLLERTAASAEAISHEKIPEQGRGETILFVDDQQQVLETGKEVLEELGYQVLTAINGQQAVALFEAHVDEIDLCIFDIIMPVMDGSRAAELIRRIRPDIKIIFSTGYDKLSRADMINEVVINKPFPIEEMGRLIRRELDEQ